MQAGDYWATDQSLGGSDSSGKILHRLGILAVGCQGINTLPSPVDKASFLELDELGPAMESPRLGTGECPALRIGEAEKIPMHGQKLPDGRRSRQHGYQNVDKNRSWGQRQPARAVIWFPLNPPPERVIMGRSTRATACHGQHAAPSVLAPMITGRQGAPRKCSE